MSDKELGIIGIGNMGSAFIRGILTSQVVKAQNIIIYDINKELLTKKSKEYNIDNAENNIDLVQKAQNILIAVKPQIIDSVLQEISSSITKEHILISIAAGITIAHIKEFITTQTGIIRVMPNTPALIGAGASAISFNENTKEKDLEYVKKILKSIGIVVELEEKHIDAVTGLSGSGPAYVFVIIEALADGGVKMGLSREIALKLAAQTVLGASKMVLETGKHPGELKDMVTSPGGTTIAALHEIEKGKLRSTLISAVEAATLKSKSIK
ncbi:MAG: pyrroline-5-carboxylate reductase [Promethearchaeota archaeon]|nr:MAG: pyrroline-5-carboxylate reductase [Candidatus Lokiarchaeota archaeon]